MWSQAASSSAPELKVKSLSFPLPSTSVLLPVSSCPIPVFFWSYQIPKHSLKSNHSLWLINLIGNGCLFPGRYSAFEGINCSALIYTATSSWVDGTLASTFDGYCLRRHLGWMAVFQLCLDSASPRGSRAFTLKPKRTVRFLWFCWEWDNWLKRKFKPYKIQIFTGRKAPSLQLR